MKLRKRAAKAVQCKEDASEDSGGSPESSSDEDVYEPGQNPRHTRQPEALPKAEIKRSQLPLLKTLSYWNLPSSISISEAAWMKKQ